MIGISLDLGRIVDSMWTGNERLTYRFLSWASSPFEFIGPVFSMFDQCIPFVFNVLIKILESLLTSETQLEVHDNGGSAISLLPFMHFLITRMSLEIKSIPYMLTRDISL